MKTSMTGSLLPGVTKSFIKTATVAIAVLTFGLATASAEVCPTSGNKALSNQGHSSAKPLNVKIAGNNSVNTVSCIYALKGKTKSLTHTQSAIVPVVGSEWSVDPSGQALVCDLSKDKCEFNLAGNNFQATTFSLDAQNSLEQERGGFDYGIYEAPDRYTVFCKNSSEGVLFKRSSIRDDRNDGYTWYNEEWRGNKSLDRRTFIIGYRYENMKQEALKKEIGEEYCGTAETYGRE